jgi:Predicted Zn-dependent peptidases, insulinase-like
MQLNDVIQGFQVKRIRPLEELKARLVEMEHLGTGAKLCWLDRPDENKAFSIAFKTLPEDSTGVFHILEHSVLCGSDKYPVKEPFVELLKSSVQTFLNALTFPDKTVYPVSTRNDQDFLNLIDVYLDAVLHPAIYHKPEIFRQEGWRYEGEGDQIGYQGVVFNEMKGSMASPMSVMAHETNALLCPDNCYRFNSGGDPACIPDLTYEQFIANHRKYYHPSNSRISLVGSVDLEPVLKKIDSFLSAFTRQEADFPIPMQEPVPAVTRVIPYEIGPEENPEKRALIGATKLIGAYDETEKLFAAAVLTDYLAGDNEAPLKRAVLDSGLAQDFTLELDSGVQQAVLSWIAMNTEQENLEALRKILRDTLTKLAEEGLDKDRLSACFHRYAFNKRDREGGWAPRSLLEAVTMLDTWLYGGDPADALIAEPALKALEAGLESGLFEKLLREFFLEDAHTVTVVLVPSRTLGEEKRAKEAARVKAESGRWTEADKARQKDQAESLRLWQQTPDSPEALASIPMLKLEDLAEKPEPLEMTETDKAGVPVMKHSVGSGIAFLRAHFLASDLTPEELSKLAMLCQVLGSMATKKHSRSALPLEIKNILGRVSFVPSVLPGSDPLHGRVMLSVSAACLAELGEKAAELLAELLTETLWEDADLLRDVMQQASVAAKMTLAGNGINYAITRALSYQTAHGAAGEAIGGVTFLQWLDKTLNAGEEGLKALLADMAGLAKRLVSRERLTVSVSEAFGDAALDRFLSLIPACGAVPAPEASYPLLGVRREGIVIPAQVGFAVMGTSFALHGRKYSGSIPVLANVLNYMYLWNEIRVQGGAYGCGFIGRDTGDAAFYTYRDPQPVRSLGVIARAPEFLRQFCAASPDLTGFILSSVSTLDPLRTPEEKISAAETRRFLGIAQEEMDRRYAALIHTTPEDLLALAGILEDIAGDDAVCVAAGKDLLEACGDRITETITV